MFLLITYDVSTRDERAGARRLRRVAKACTSYGVRVQKSVFEMQLGQKEWVELKARLLAEIDVAQDSLRVYYIDQSGKDKIEHHGAQIPVNVVEDTLSLKTGQATQAIPQTRSLAAGRTPSQSSQAANCERKIAAGQDRPWSKFFRSLTVSQKHLRTPSRSASKTGRSRPALTSGARIETRSGEDRRRHPRASPRSHERGAD